MATGTNSALVQMVADYQGLRDAWRKDPVLYAKTRIGMNPTRQQQQLLEAIAPAGAKVSVRAGHGVGKAQPVSLIVDTPTGKKRWGDLQVGDTLFGVSGKPVKISAIYPQGELPVFKVAFDDNSETRCCGDHIWTTQGRNQRRGDRVGGPANTWIDLTTAQLLKAGVIRRNGITTTRSWRLPAYAPVEYPSAPVPIDPYLFGLWLGDGGRVPTARDNLSITSEDQEILDYPRSIGIKTREQPDKRTDGTVSLRIQDGGKTRSALIGLGMEACYSYEKYVPKCYLENDTTTRLHVLQGLLDTDGTVTGSGLSCVSFSSSSEQLVSDVEWLARSLGAKAKRQNPIPTFYTKPDGARVDCRLSYETTMAFPVGVTPFRLTRKLTMLTPSTEARYLARWFDSITPDGAEDCMCVKVDAPDGLYLTNDFIVTHNTTAVSVSIWWHLECFDNCRIPCTAPTASQLRSVLWSEIGKVLGRANEQAVRLKLHPLLFLGNLFVKNQDFVYEATKPSPDTISGKDQWYAQARTARRDQPDALQGFHASDVNISDDDVAVKRSEHGGALMFVIEEASGVPDEIFQVAEGALSSPDARLLMVGNPVRNDGFFADSHKASLSSYTALHFSCLNSPLTAPNYVSDLKRKYGADSNVVRVRAYGEFPKQDDDVLIPLELTEASLKRDPIGDDGSRKILGVDVARFGDDRTTFVIRQGRSILYVEVDAKKDTMQTTGKALAIAGLWGVNAIHVDVIGIGAGVVDRLKELKTEYDIVAVNVADSATITPVSRDKRSNKTPDDKYGRQEMIPRIMRDYLWLEMFAWYANDEPILASVAGDWLDHAKDLSAECATVRYTFDSSGKMTMEAKDAMKKRGLRSPDLADALALTFSPNKMNIWEMLGR